MGGVSSFFHISIGVRQGCILAPTLFNTFSNWALGIVVNQSHCKENKNVEHLLAIPTVSNLVFSNDVVSLPELLKFLVLTYESLHKVMKPFGTYVFCP